MGTLRQAFPRTVVVVCLTIVAIEALVLVSQLGRSPFPHRVPLGIAAPAVVGSSLASSADALPGHPFAAQVLDYADAAAAFGAARAAVRDGTSFAAVALDLTAETDTLFVSTVADAELNRAVRVRVAAVEGGWGRRLRVASVPPSRNGQVSRAAAYVLTALWVVLGFACTAGLTLARGPVAATFRLATARVVGLALACFGLSLVVAGLSWVFWGVFGTMWILGAATMLGAAWTTLALESLAQLAGIGAATTLFVLLAAPLFGLGDPRLLPQPWAAVTPWTLHGAALDVANRLLHFDAAPVLRALCVLAAWIWLPLLTMAVARRERVRR
jgi:hypothetical protein